MSGAYSKEYIEMFYKNVWERQNRKYDFRFFGYPYWRGTKPLEEINELTAKCNNCGGEVEFEEIQLKNCPDFIHYAVYCNNCGHGAIDIEPDRAFDHFGELEKTGEQKLAEVITEYASFPFRGN